MKKFGAIILTVLILAFSLTGCSPKFLDENEFLNIENPTGTIKIGILEYGEETPAITVEFGFVLYYMDAPNTVANFIKLVEEGYYNGKSVEQATGNSPFVEFGKKEFIEDETEDENGEAYDKPLYTKRPVNPAYYIIGEFFTNGYYFGSREDNNPRNKKHAGLGSMMMMRDTDNDNPMSKYNTAYAAFTIQTDVNETKRKPYEESFCVFGQITRLNNLTSFDETGFKSELIEEFFNNDKGLIDHYDSRESCKFMIMSIEIDIIKGVNGDIVPKSAFVPRKI